MRINSDRTYVDIQTMFLNLLENKQIESNIAQYIVLKIKREHSVVDFLESPMDTYIYVVSHYRHSNKEFTLYATNE